jgi:long-chain acyl-CoA synthetase
MDKGDTLPKILRQNYLKYGERKIALRKKQFGLWQEYTWKDYYEAVKCFGLGLIKVGLQTGDVVAIVGDIDPEWFIAELSTLSVGGKAVGVFTDGLPAELEYIIAHAGATIIVAKDQEQIDKIIAIRERIPGLRKMIYWEDKGLWNYNDPQLISFDEVQKLGQELGSSNQGLFEQLIEKGEADDIAVLCYTSGTTGTPKGAMLTHRNLLFYAENLQELKEPLKDESYVAYQSPAWIWEQWAGMCVGLLFPMVIHFCEEPETVIQDIREISPFFLVLGSRQWESFASTVQTKIRETNWWKRMCYNWGMGVGYKVSGLMQEGENPSWLLKTKYRLADRIVLRAVRDRLGLSRGRFLLIGGASMSPDIFRFFHAMGALIRIIYGGTEYNVVSSTRPQDYSFDTVGYPFSRVEVKISDEGEILVRGEQVFKGYHKDPETTNKRIDHEGWFHTGDAGTFNSKGQLIFWDRMGELIELADGNKFSPQYIETRLRFSSYIENAFVIGDKNKNFIVAIIAIDFSNVGKWAEERNLPFTTFVDLSQKPEVLMLMKDEVNRVNQNLPEFAKVRKFVNLHKSFDADEAELTRTRKLKRAVLYERYDSIIRATYDGEESFSLEATVTYRDGRKGTVKAEVFINNT